MPPVHAQCNMIEEDNLDELVNVMKNKLKII